MVGYPHQGTTFGYISGFPPESDSVKLNLNALAETWEKADGT
jgi:hypothetical protein